jgi:hypothetical protein
MRKPLTIIGILFGVVVLLLVILRIVGLDPGTTRPGMWLTGELVTKPISDWTFAAKERNFAVQTRQWFLPILAHSVTATRWHYDGKLYAASLYPAGVKLPDGRHWNRNVLADPRVRIKIGNKLYDRKLVYVTDPAERDPVYRLAGAIHFAPGFFLHLWRVEPLDDRDR